MTGSAADAPIRVAIVDDNPDHADILALRLQLEGFQTRAFYSGADLLAAQADFQPQCVLFDIVMPDIDGLALAKKLRESSGDDVILLAMTGQDTRDLRVADTFNLVDHYYKKPVAIELLLKVLRAGEA